MEKPESEIRVMQSQAQECKGIAQSHHKLNSNETFFPGASKGPEDTWISDLRFPEL